jgi:hypothetical protein
MSWFSGQVDAAVIAGVVSLSISLTIALLVTKRATNLQPDYAPEGVARAMLRDRQSHYRTFRSLKYHLSGFTDDELRKILVRAGGIRLTAGGQEVWGLLSRNRSYLSIDDIKEVPTTEVTVDCLAQEQNQQQEVKLQDERDLSRNSSEPFERVRAEMLKLSALECVRPAVRQE